MHARELAEAVLIDMLPTNLAMARWACERWNEEVRDRPMDNVYRKTLDETWRQVIRRCGYDPEVAIANIFTWESR